MDKKVLKRIYDSLAYTHKIHEQEAYQAKIAITIVRFTSIALLTVALFLQFIEIKYTENDFMNVSIIFTVLSVFIQIFELSFGFENKHDAFRSTAKSAVSLKNRLRIFISELDQKTINERDAIVDEINGLYKTAPQTGKLAQWFVNRKD